MLWSCVLESQVGVVSKRLTHIITQTSHESLWDGTQSSGDAADFLVMHDVARLRKETAAHQAIERQVDIYFNFSRLVTYIASLLKQDFSYSSTIRYDTIYLRALKS